MSFDEIEIRIKNRISKNLEDHKIILGHSFVLDVDNVRAEYNGECIGLTKQEFKILKTLSNKKLIAKYDLIDTVWGERALLDDNNINTHLANLRRKIEVTPFRVLNVRGKGFYLESLKDH